MPSANHSFYLRGCYLENRLAKGTMTVANQRLDLHRITDVATFVTLATLTALTLLSDGGPAWLGALSDAIRGVGYEISGWVGEHWQALGGLAFQIAIPLTLALVLSRLGGSLAASVAAWWLGHNFVHIARFIQAVEQDSSQAFQGHAWSVSLPSSPFGDSNEIIPVVHWVGVVLMSAVLLYLLRRIVRQLLLRLP